MTAGRGPRNRWSSAKVAVLAGRCGWGVLAMVAAGSIAPAAELEPQLWARDSFDGAALAAMAEDPLEAESLRAIGWPPQAFPVQVDDRGAAARPRVELHFPAPSPGIGRADRGAAVRVCWWPSGPLHLPEEQSARPAVLLVHSLAPGQPLARGLAQALSAAGVDAFVVDLPGFGGRPPRAGRSPGAETVLSGAGAVADVRRALDALAALPAIDEHRIVLVGISLGSFAASTVTALDNKPAALVSFLGGGSAFEGLRDGGMDAAWLVQELLAGGHPLNSLEALLAPVEPLRLARRLNPEAVYVASAMQDQVILPDNTEAFVRAIGGGGLAESHWLRRPGDHYTAAFALPGLAELLTRLARESTPRP